MGKETGIGILEALKAASDIMKSITKSEDGQDRANIRLASRKLKQLRRQLSKKGWEDWEVEVYNDLIKSYAKQLKKLMIK